jgi:hypothetical protein
MRHIHRKFIRLLRQEEFDLDRIIEMIEIGNQWQFFGIKIGNGHTIGLFCTAHDNNSTVFSILAKKGILSSVIPILFNHSDSIIAREKKSDVHSVDDIIDNFLLTPVGHNTLYHATKAADYEAWAKIAEYGFVTKLAELVKQVDFEGTELVELAVISLVKDYSKLFYSLSEVLQQPEHLGYIKELVKRVKEEQYDLKKDNTLRLATLFNREWSDVLDNDENVEQELYNKILTVVDTAEAYDSQLKIQLQSTCGVKEYVLNDLFQQYFKYDLDFGFKLNKIDIFLNGVNSTINNQRSSIVEDDIITNAREVGPIMDNSRKITLFDAFGLSLLSFFCGIMVSKWLHQKKNAPNIDSILDKNDSFFFANDKNMKINEFINQELLKAREVVRSSADTTDTQEKQMQYLTKFGAYLKNLSEDRTIAERDILNSRKDKEKYGNNEKNELTNLLSDFYTEEKFFEKKLSHYKYIVKKLKTTMNIQGDTLSVTTPSVAGTHISDDIIGSGVAHNIYNIDESSTLLGDSG